jgi:hypothetical protein
VEGLDAAFEVDEGPVGFGEAGDGEGEGGGACGWGCDMVERDGGGVAGGNLRVGFEDDDGFALRGDGAEGFWGEVCETDAVGVRGEQDEAGGGSGAVEGEREVGGGIGQGGAAAGDDDGGGGGFQGQRDDGGGAGGGFVQPGGECELNEVVRVLADDVGGEIVEFGGGGCGDDDGGFVGFAGDADGVVVPGGDLTFR